VSKSRLIVIGPLPPPVHGVAVSTSLVLASPRLRQRFAVEHVDTSDHRVERNTGRWDLENVLLGLGALSRLARQLSAPRGVVYVPLSQNTAAFLRDSLFIWAAHLRGWKIAGHLRGSDFRTFFEQSPRPLQRWMRWTLRLLDSVAVMGETLRWVFDGLVPVDRIAVVPNGTPTPDAADIESDPNHVLFLSNLRRRKGVKEAVEAALLVRARRPLTRFTFAGDWESAELEESIRACTASENGGIVFRPPIHGGEKDALLASASVFLFPPVEPEGHPRVVIEALAAGLPIVTTDRGAIRETVVDGESGFVLDEPEPGVLADRILELLSDAGLRARMSHAARCRYSAEFTQKRADERLADWLSSVVSSA
jgi:glycosyltransferase involved in cell wall biosynthesis